ncbi:hypothetical protein HID58_062358 [Brassica napus]|uniref:Uncharacterized protein n=1 Tax=Brassica napus TaxID=3708 RepID=A0ABQ8A176_BRANA|nr:hypothetical protein HID58_062358 [Brassica napus]
MVMVETVAIDAAKDMVTVKGTMDVKELVSFLANSSNEPSTFSSGQIDDSATSLAKTEGGKKKEEFFDGIKDRKRKMLEMAERRRKKPDTVRSKVAAWEEVLLSDLSDKKSECCTNRNMNTLFGMITDDNPNGCAL